MEEQFFGSQLKMQRELRNWTRIELAQQIGSSSKTIARWERGESFPQLHFHQKLCMLFNLSPEALRLEVKNTENNTQSPRPPRHQTTIGAPQYKRGYTENKASHGMISGASLKGLLRSNDSVEFHHGRNIYITNLALLLSLHDLNKCMVSLTPSLISPFYQAFGPVECALSSFVFIPTGGGKSQFWVFSMIVEAFGGIQNCFVGNRGSYDELDAFLYGMTEAPIEPNTLYKRLIANARQNSILCLSFKGEAVLLQLGVNICVSEKPGGSSFSCSGKKVDAYTTRQRRFKGTQPRTRGGSKIPTYQIARNLADLYRYARVSKVLVLSMANSLQFTHSFKQEGHFTLCKISSR